MKVGFFLIGNDCRAIATVAKNGHVCFVRTFCKAELRTDDFCRFCERYFRSHLQLKSQADHTQGASYHSLNWRSQTHTHTVTRTVEVYRRFTGPCFLHHHGNECNNPDDSQQSSDLAPWKPRIQGLFIVLIDERARTFFFNRCQQDYLAVF